MRQRCGPRRRRWLGYRTVSLPDSTHELSVAAEPTIGVHVNLGAIGSVTSEKTHPRIISIARTLIHPGQASQASPAGLSPDGFNEKCETNSASVVGLV